MNTASAEAKYQVVVLELTDVVTRIYADRPNIYVGLSTRTAQELMDGLNRGKLKPAWARNNVTGVRAEFAPTQLFTLDEAKTERDALIRQLRRKGYRVNRIKKAYRTYVIDLHNPELKNQGNGYVYVGQSHKSPEVRLQEHLTDARSAKGIRLASRKVLKYGQQLNYDLMTRRVYLDEKQALKAERRLADRLRAQGYIVEGGH